MDKNLLKDDDGLGDLIKKLSNKELGILDFSENNSLNEYRAIRNICVHSDSHSKEGNNKLSDAERFLKGIKIDSAASIKKEKGKGKGRIKLEKEFLPSALELHFNVIFKVHDFIKNKHA